MRRFIMLGAAFLLVLFGSTMTVQAETKVMENGVHFDAEFYLADNPDVAAAVGENEEMAFLHYMNFGIGERRQPISDEEMDEAIKPYFTKADIMQSDNNFNFRNLEQFAEVVVNSERIYHQDGRKEFSMVYTPPVSSQNNAVITYEPTIEEVESWFEWAETIWKKYYGIEVEEVEISKLLLGVFPDASPKGYCAFYDYVIGVSFR